MKLRSQRRRAEVSIESMLPTFADDGHRNNPQPAWSETAEDLLQRREACQIVRDRIAMLPEDHRTVLILRDIEELDTVETARVLGINPGAVKTRLHRARMAFRELLDADFSS
jgi:RNA polymerase sigma-70 factor (ECF subfamily)